MDPENFVKLVKDCRTYNEVHVRSKYCIQKVKSLIVRNKIDISHFTPWSGKRKRVQKTYTRECLSCENEFTTIYKKQRFCSHKCSNSFTPHNPISQYQTICFKHHKKECIICGENIVVEAHHYDKNRNNNRPENLVPLCPTHHRYMHNKTGKTLICSKVAAYVEQFKATS